MDPWVIAIVVLFVMNAFGWAGVLVQMDSVKMVRRQLEDEQNRLSAAEYVRNEAVKEAEKLRRQIEVIKEAMK